MSFFTPTNVYKPNILTHLLTFNERNTFNKYHKLLSDIETLIYRMESGFPTGVEYGPDGVPLVDKGKGTVNLDDDNQYRKLGTALQGIENSYRQAFFLIIQILYNRIYNSIHNQKDRAILFHKLDILNRWLALHPWDQKTESQVLGLSTKNIEKYLKDYNRYKYVDDKTDLGDKLIETIEDFKKVYLTEPHEKSD